MQRMGADSSVVSMSENKADGGREGSGADLVGFEGAVEEAARLALAVLRAHRPVLAAHDRVVVRRARDALGHPHRVRVHVVLAGFTPATDTVSTGQDTHHTTTQRGQAGEETAAHWLAPASEAWVPRGQGVQGALLPGDAVPGRHCSHRRLSEENPSPALRTYQRHHTFHSDSASREALQFCFLARLSQVF